MPPPFSRDVIADKAHCQQWKMLEPWKMLEQWNSCSPQLHAVIFNDVELPQLLQAWHDKIN